MKISIIGCGYVGMVTGTCFAEFGHDVIFFDIVSGKLTAIRDGSSPIYEDGLDDLLKKNHDHISTTTNILDAIVCTEITFVCVGTPSHDDGSIDLTQIKSASIQIGKALKNIPDFHFIIVKSTVFPGTIEGVIKSNLENESGKKAFLDFGLASNPEFLREGNAIHDFVYPDRIILGCEDDKTKTILQMLYNKFDCPKFFTSIKTAEMIKYTSNAFLATKISFANEIGNLCKKIGIDSREVFKGVGLDKRINPAFFNSGIGFGGSCFPKDVMALIKGAEEYLGENTILLKSVIKVNDEQPLKLISLLKKYIPELKGAKIGIFGLAFKPETDDIRESRAIPIVKHLLDEGAEIVAYDAQAMDNFKALFPSLHYANNREDVLNSDAVLILTEWKEFEELDYSNSIVIDGRRIQKAIDNARQYEGVCW